MGRRKATWFGRLLSYGPDRHGFTVTFQVDDHTDSYRTVKVRMDAQTLRRIADRAAATEEAGEG
jgi:hypothetical protein